MCELQEAYNEWLLLFGYREVESECIGKIDMNIKVSYADFQECVAYDAGREIYTLKPLSEVQHLFKKENKNE